MLHSFIVALSFLLSNANAYPLDYYKLALQWPPTFHLAYHPRLPQPRYTPSYFTIHGLWPTNITGGNSLCPTNYQSILGGDSKLLSKMIAVWPDLKYFPTKKNEPVYEDFWELEWNKHGSCSPFTQLDYMKHTLQLYTSVNLGSIVKANGALAPGSRKTKSSIMRIISTLTGATPELKCYKDPRAPAASPRNLFEIRVCFPPTGTTANNCKGNSPTCGPSSTIIQLP